MCFISLSGDEHTMSSDPAALPWHNPHALAAHPHPGPSYSEVEDGGTGTPVLSPDICRAFLNSETRPLSWRKWILTRARQKQRATIQGCQGVGIESRILYAVRVGLDGTSQVFGPKLASPKSRTHLGRASTNSAFGFSEAGEVSTEFPVPRDLRGVEGWRVPLVLHSLGVPQLCGGGPD